METVNGKPIYLHGKTWDELFEDVREEYSDRPEGYFFCALSGNREGFGGVAVKPTAVVLDHVERHMIPGLTYFFEAVVRVDGTVLVCAKHNEIISSHWLSIMPRDSVPAIVLA